MPIRQDTHPLSWLLPAAALFALAVSLLNRPAPVPGIAPTEAYALMRANHALVLDVRDKAPYVDGHLPDALSVPIDQLDRRMHEFAAYRALPVLVYCGDGVGRGPLAAAKLKHAGFQRAVNLDGGFPNWRAAGLPIAK